jgi:hypothetical protein
MHKNANNKRKIKNDNDNNIDKKIKQEQQNSVVGSLIKSSLSPLPNLELAHPEEQVKDEEKEPEFFTTSMYTDEFNTMLETVLENEKFLFDNNELEIFQTFQTLKGKQCMSEIKETLY